MWSIFLLNIIKAIPAINSLFLKVVELYYTQQDAADERRVSDRAEERDKIISELKTKELSDDERNKLRKALYNSTRR